MKKAKKPKDADIFKINKEKANSSSIAKFLKQFE